MKWANESSLGLDISDSHITVVSVIQSNICPVIQKMDQIPIPTGLVQDGFVTNPNELAKVLRQLLKRNGIQSQQATVNIDPVPTLIQVFNLPESSGINVSQYVLNELRHTFVSSVDDICFDYHAIQMTQTDGPKRVYVVAVEKSKVLPLVTALHKVGIHPAAIEPRSLAIMRTIYSSKVINQYGQLIYVGNINSKGILSCVFHNTDLCYVRMVNKPDGGFNPGTDAKWCSDQINTVLQYYVTENRTLSSTPWVCYLQTSIPELLAPEGVRVFRESVKGTLTNFSAIELLGRLPTPIADPNYDSGISAYGLGMKKKLLRSPFRDINLLPRSVLRRQRLRNQSRIALYVLLFLFAIVNMMLIGWDGISQNKQQRMEVHHPGAYREQLAACIQQHKQYMSQYNMLYERWLLLRQVYANATKIDWGEILHHIAKSTPQRIRLNSIEIEGDDLCIISGETSSQDDINVFCLEIKKYQYIHSTDVAAVSRSSGSMMSFTIKVHSTNNVEGDRYGKE